MENKTSIISVEGVGRIEVAANLIQINITVHKTTDSIKQSQEEVNKIVSGILNILKENKINNKNIHTASIEFYPNYTWEENSKKYLGQKVEQTIVCIIENLKNNLDKAVKIMDNITVGNDSIILNLSFGIKEDNEISIKCRELAYHNGYEKAKRYAELAGLKIVKALKISEDEPERTRYNSSYRRSSLQFSDIDVGGYEPTQIPVGNVEKTMTLYIDFLAE
jgi:uncharacterized protein YggE